MNIYVITNNNFMLVGLKCMFSDNSLSVNRVVFSRVSDIAFSNSDVVIVESELNTGDAERLKYLHISPVNRFCVTASAVPRYQFSPCTRCWAGNKSTNSFISSLRKDQPRWIC